MEAGDELAATGGEQEFPVWVTEIDEEQATIDANHPLAGETLIFEVEIVSVAAA